jgi:hypothetical protein
MSTTDDVFFKAIYGTYILEWKSIVSAIVFKKK